MPSYAVEEFFDEEKYLESLPEDAKEYLGDRAADGDFSISELFSLAGQAFVKSFEGVLKRLPGLVMLIVCAGVCCALSDGSMKNAARAISSFVILIYSLDIIGDIYSYLSLKVDELTGFCGALSGIFGSFLIFGGAGLGAGTLTAFLTLLCTLVSYMQKYLFPAVCAALILTSVSHISNREGFSGAAKHVCSFYSVISCGTLSLLSLIVSFQMKASTGADSMAIRGAKIASAYAIPVVGGVISESIENITGGFAALKGSFGLGAACVIIFTVLPAFARVLCYKLAFTGISIFCDMAGIKECGRIISDTDSFFTVSLITLAVVSLSFLYAVLLFCGAGVSV